MGNSIEVIGMKDLTKYLLDNVKMSDIKRIVRFHGSKLQVKAQSKAVFKGHWGYVPGKKGKQFIKPTGTLKRSIGIKIDSGGMRAIVEPGTNYGGYVEVGTRKMAAQPYLKPALEIVGPGFVDDIERVMKR